MPRLRVATYNVHAGVDGWGRPTDVVDAAVALDADVLVLQEAWRSERTDLAREVAARTGATAHEVALAEGWRVLGGSGTARWQHRLGLLVGNRGLFLTSVHALPAHGERRLAAAPRAEHGEWCVAIVSRLPVRDVTEVPLPQLRRDLARRTVLVATLATPAGELVVVGVHGSHLTHGSLDQYRAMARALEREVGDRPAILAGDLNSWGPLARRVLPGWRQAVRGRTWPSWRPHSQLDHVFVRGPIEVLGGGPRDVRESDHRPVVAELSIR